MFVETWHDFHKVAGHVAIIKLVVEDLVPGVFTGPGEPGRAKKYVPFATPAQARDWMGGGANFFVRYYCEISRESVNFFS